MRPGDGFGSRPLRNRALYSHDGSLFCRGLLPLPTKLNRVAQQTFLLAAWFPERAFLSSSLGGAKALTTVVPDRREDAAFDLDQDCASQHNILQCTMTICTDKLDKPLRLARIVVAEDDASSMARATLISIKRTLLSACTMVQDTADHARRAGNVDHAERLRRIAEQLADELDDVDAQLCQAP